VHGNGRILSFVHSATVTDDPMNGRSPLRIAFLVRAYPTVSETFIRDQIEGLAERGHSVDVISLYAGASVEAGGPGRHVRYLIGPELPLAGALARAAGRVVRSLASPAVLARLTPTALTHPVVAAEAVHAIPRLRNATPVYDVVHAHFGPTGLLALELRRLGLLRGALVTTFHGVDVTRYPAARGPGVYRPLFARGELFTANSGFTEGRALTLGAPRGRLFRLPVGVDLSRIPFRPRTPRPGEPVRLLSVGRLEAVKGFRYGLEALARLSDGGIEARYTVIGGGRLEGDLRRRAAELKIAARVSFAGALSFDAVLAEYARHDLFLMPGIVTEDGQTEAQGRVLIEAQASGMPVVASDVGGIPETLAPGAGRLVPPGDAAGLAAAIRELVEAGDGWPAMGEAGRRHVEECCDQEALLQRLIDLYHTAMAGVVGGASST
jgi:colanic acid/amylovoran biosynthesis glycosyltransferase